MAVAMEDIASRSGVTRRTLYRYYQSKEDLVYEVVTDLLEEWNRDLGQALPSGRGKALRRLGEFLNGLVGLLDQRRALLRLMGEFDFVFRDAETYQPGTEEAERFSRAAAASDAVIEGLIREGQADGSIRRGIKPKLVVPVMSTVLWGLAQRVAIREGHIQAEFGLSGTELARAQIDLYLAALANK
jgi:AcrR family transcriptional regulator